MRASLMTVVLILGVVLIVASGDPRLRHSSFRLLMAGFGGATLAAFVGMILE